MNTGAGVCCRCRVQQNSFIWFLQPFVRVRHDGIDDECPIAVIIGLPDTVVNGCAAWCRKADRQRERGNASPADGECIHAGLLPRRRWKGSIFSSAPAGLSRKTEKTPDSEGIEGYGDGIRRGGTAQGRLPEISQLRGGQSGAGSGLSL
jgi:hypothetical protein